MLLHLHYAQPMQLYFLVNSRVVADVFAFAGLHVWGRRCRCEGPAASVGDIEAGDPSLSRYMDVGVTSIVSFVWSWTMVLVICYDT